MKKPYKSVAQRAKQLEQEQASFISDILKWPINNISLTATIILGLYLYSLNWSSVSKPTQYIPLQQSIKTKYDYQKILLTASYIGTILYYFIASYQSYFAQVEEREKTYMKPDLNLLFNLINLAISLCVFIFQWISTKWPGLPTTNITPPWTFYLNEFITSPIGTISVISTAVVTYGLLFFIPSLSPLAKGSLGIFGRLASNAALTSRNTQEIKTKTPVGVYQHLQYYLDNAKYRIGQYKLFDPSFTKTAIGIGMLASYFLPVKVQAIMGILAAFTAVPKFRIFPQKDYTQQSEIQ